MKRIYYFDIVMMTICVTLYIVFFKDIKNIFYILTFTSYILCNAYISFRLRLVKKFNKDIKMTHKFKIGSIYLFLGKLLFIAQIILICVYDQEKSLIFMLFYFMVMSLLILEHAYIDDKKVIKLSGKYILLKDISSYRVVDNYNESIYLDIYDNSDMVFRCSLSKNNFDLFIKEQY